MRASPFFEGISQVQLTHDGENLEFPISYYDASAMTAVFPARLGSLRRLLPDPRFVPARLAPGVGALAISCFEYRDTGIGPYNELAVSVVLHEPPYRANLPGRTLTASLRRRQLHAFVHHLPVTTKTALVGGRDFYNFPKFIAGIDFSDDDGRWTCRLSEGSEHILTLRGRRIPTPDRQELQVFSHLWMDRQPQSAEFKLNLLEAGTSWRPTAAVLELGTRHPIATELDGLLLRRQSLYYQLMPRLEGILYGPEHLTFPLIERAHQAVRDREPMGA